MPKHAAETSTEYTTRVLSMTSLDPVPVEALAALYREARFSRHELDQGHRERAVSALLQIHASLAAYHDAVALAAVEQAAETGLMAGAADRGSDAR